MRRIDTPDGLYHDFDPQSGEAGTIVKAAPMNAIQEEIIAVITGAGLTLDPNANNQLWQAIQAITGGGVAWGAITGKPDTATRWPAWAEVTSKPATFPPDAHTHAIAEVTSLQAALDVKADLAGADFAGSVSLPAGVALKWVRGVTPLDVLVKEPATAPTYGAGDAVVLRNANAAGIEFHTNGQSRLVIDSSGAATFAGPVSASNVTASSNVVSSQNFIAATANAVLAATGAGTILLRPNGSSSSTGQTFISSAGNMSVSGSVTAGGGFQVGSSEHLKTDLEPLPYGLDEVDAIAVRRGRYIPEFNANGRRRLFVIAEQLATVVPEAVFEDGVEHDGKRYASVEYSQLVPVLISAVQELSARLRAIEKASLIA